MDEHQNPRPSRAWTGHPVFVLITWMADFTKIFDHVRDLVLYGDAHLRIWVAKEIKLENGLVANTAPTFFGLTLEAHLDRALLNAAKTFDCHRDALNSRKLLNCASEKNRGTLEARDAQRLAEFFPEAEQRLKEIETNLAAIQTRRDKTIAHLDRKTVSDPQKVIADSRITLDEKLKRVYAVAWGIIQDVSTWNATPLLPLTDVEDYEWPLRLIRSEKHRQFDELRKLNKP